MEKFVIESQMFWDFKHAEWKQTLSQTNAGVVLCVVCFNSRPASLTIWHHESSKSGGISDQFSLGSNKRLPFPLEFTSIFPGSTPVVFPNLSMSRHYLQILHSVWAVHTGMLSSQQGSHPVLTHFTPGSPLGVTAVSRFSAAHWGSVACILDLLSHIQT